MTLLLDTRQRRRRICRWHAAKLWQTRAKLLKLNLICMHCQAKKTPTYDPIFGRVSGNNKIFRPDFFWAQFTLETCVAARNREKITKNPSGVQSRSR